MTQEAAAATNPADGKPVAPQPSGASAGFARNTPDLQPLPLDTTSPQFTWRALLTGTLLAAVLSSCNVYLGLKIGIGLNMAITAALLGYGFWAVAHALTPARRLGMLENTISLTAAAAGASVASAGLVGPLPALAILTGQTLPWYWLMLWIFSVCLVGIAVAIGLRRQMLFVDKLPFVTGIATAETVRELYAKGNEALQRVVALVSAALVAAPLQWATQIRPARLTQVVLPMTFSIKGLAAKALTFGLNTTLLLYAVGGLIGIRTCISLAVGAVIAWGVLTPALIQGRYIRLEVAEPLAALPAGVTLPPEPNGYARFDDGKHQLVWRGVMTPAARAALRALSPDTAYQEAIQKLYVRSQLELSVPLAGLPGEVPLPPDAPITFDAPRGLLVARRGLDHEAYVALQRHSDDPQYRAALEKLHNCFAYTTTRQIQVSESSPGLPAGLRIPRALSGVLRYEPGRRALVATGPLDATVVRKFAQDAAERGQRDPQQKPAADAFVRVLQQLLERAEKPALPSGFQIPEPLAGRFSCDPSAGTLQGVGILTQADAKALLSVVPTDAPGCADYQATVNALVAATAYRPVEPTFSGVITWLLWPGVALMVVASLLSFAFSWRSIVAGFAGRRKTAGAELPAYTGEVSRRWFIRTLVISLVLSVTLQVWLFGIAWWTAGAGVLLSFLLAVVAGRVAGETNITPVAQVGKVTQLLFGALAPAHVEPNLMAANVTGGAASQCAELLHDLKCGYLLGATPRFQVWAQIWGALAGSISGSLVYINLIPDPQQRLLTEEWPAPMVAGMKAVAGLFQAGTLGFPRGAALAMLIASGLAVVLVLLEKSVPKQARAYVPSAASLGLALLIPANVSLTMLVGALVAFILGKCCKRLTSRFLVTVCVGVVAGESLTGVGMSLYKIVADWGR